MDIGASKEAQNRDSIPTLNCRPLPALRTLNTVTLKGAFSRSVALPESNTSQNHLCTQTPGSGKQRQEAFAQNKAHSTEHQTYQRHSSANARWASLDRSYSLEDTHITTNRIRSTLSTTVEEPYDGEITFHTPPYPNVPYCVRASPSSESSRSPMMNNKMSHENSVSGSVIRTRPPLPTGLSPINKGNTDNQVGDLAGVLNSMRGTDFVRKYSRQGRGSASTSGTTTPALHTPLFSPTGYLSPRSNVLAPQLSPSPSATHVASHLRQINLVKSKLEEMASKEQEEKPCTPSEIKVREDDVNNRLTESEHLTSSNYEGYPGNVRNMLVGSKEPGQCLRCDSTKDKVTFENSGVESKQTFKRVPTYRDSDSSVTRTPEENVLSHVQTNSQLNRDSTGHEFGYCADNTYVCSDLDRKNNLDTQKDIFSYESSECNSSAVATPSDLYSLTDNTELCLKLSGTKDTRKASGHEQSEFTDDEGVGEEVQLRETYPRVYSDVISQRSYRKSKGNTPLSIDLESLNYPFVPQKAQEPVPESPRLANGRFLTHPPVTKTVTQETGSVDSNGLHALGNPEMTISSASDLTASVTSFDSHVCSSESTDAPTADGGSTLGLERENSRTRKKCKSDPMDNQRITRADLTTVVMQHLKKEQASKSEKQTPVTVSVVQEDEDTPSPYPVNESTLRIVKPKTSPHSRIQLQLSDDSSSTEEAFVKTKRRSSKTRHRANSDKLPLKLTVMETVTKSLTSAKSGKSKTLPRLSSIPLSLSGPDSSSSRNSKGLAPEEHPSKRHLALSRSHSSASIMSSRKEKFLTSRGEKESSEKSRAFKLRSPSTSQDESPTRRKQHTMFSPILRPIYSSNLSIFEGPEEGKTKRELIVKEFHSTEQQFVEALRIMVEKYMIPLKEQRLFDNNTIDTIFYKINELYMHHATFLAFLERALASWQEHTTIGDVICKTFSKQTVIESYMLFMDNFPLAEKKLDEVNAKSSFQKFTEQVEKGLNLKLPLKAQIVKPAQRIPRYELLIKRLLENTSASHEDYSQLREAEGAIHQLALRINGVKQSARREHLLDTLKQLELILLTDLVDAERHYLRHDMVQVLTQKDPVCLWLFSDLLVLSVIKRKSGPVNRKASVLLHSASGHDFVDATKQRLWYRFNLDEVELVTHSQQEEEPEKDPDGKERLENDLTVLTQMNELCKQLLGDHESLAGNLRELTTVVNKQLSDIQLKSPPPETLQLTLLATTESGEMLEVTFVFPTPEKRNQWQTFFLETREKMDESRSIKAPDFLSCLLITKTRAGMQLMCAAAVSGEASEGGARDVWVCNSDGYVGHVCLLSLLPEPMVTLNTPVPGCHSRISCICAVPPSKHRTGQVRTGSVRSRGSRPGSLKSSLQPEMTSPKVKQSPGGVQKNTDFSEDGYVSDTSTDSFSLDEGEQIGPLTFEDRASDLDQRVPPVIHGEDLLASTDAGPQANQSLMWVGTEDGSIHIFPTSENIKTTKKKVKLQLGSSVLCMVHLDNKVYVSLGNGELVVYKRDKMGVWDTIHPETVTLASTATPVNRMLCVTGRLWCISQNDIMVVNPTTLESEVTFSAGDDTRRGVQCIVTTGQCVCLAGCGSPRVQLFHATSYTHLMEISITQAVEAQLKGADEIIQKHKLACLRVTALGASREQLWVGTSAGVIVTVPLPKLSSFISTSRNASPPVPTVTGISQGHTGHVRFLLCLELPHTLGTCPQDTEPHRKFRDSDSTATSSGKPAPVCKHLLLSGGDGFEDVNRDGESEDVGKEDSTNHLLIWQT